MGLDPGRYRTILQLQSIATSKDSVGQSIETWSDIAVVWASVNALSAREQWWAQQTQATTTHLITCRYDARITPGTRFKLGERVLNIDGVRDTDERHVEMIVNCTESKDES